MPPDLSVEVILVLNRNLVKSGVQLHILQVAERLGAESGHFHLGGVDVFDGDADGAAEEAAGPSPTGLAVATRSTGESDMVADRPR